MSDTFGDLIDRTFRDFLEVVSEQTSQAPLSAQMLPGATTAIFDDVLTPEEEGRLAVGGLIEINRELMFVTDFDASSRTVTVKRQMLDTPEQTHAAGDMLRIAPKYPRQTVFNAFVDEIRGLWPSLWTVTRGEAFQLQDDLWWVPDELAVDIISARANDGSEWLPVQVHREPKLADYPDGMVVRFPAGKGFSMTGRLQVEYKRKIATPTDETDVLATLGLDSAWEIIVIYGALATLFAGREFERDTTEYLSQVLSASVPGVELGRRSSVGTTFLRVRELKLNNAKQQLRVEYPVEVEMHDPLA